MTPAEVWRRLAFWRRRDALARELADELEAHVAFLARDYEREGLSPRDARAAARRRVGNVGRLREEARDAWGFPAADVVLQDLRYALRGLARAPGFTVTVILTLGLGIGANAAMFGVIDRLMFRPLPYLREPSRVNRVYLQTTYRGRVRTSTTFPYTRYLDLGRAGRAVEQLAGVSEWRVAVGTGDAARVRKIAGVSASFFDFFDARPALGRYFTAAEDSVPEGARVAVLSHEFWTREFARRDVTGQSLLVGTLAYTIIGVAPPGFVGTVRGAPPAVFIPITTVAANIDRSNQASYYSGYTWDWTDVLVRRAPGVPVAEASRALTDAFIASRRAQRAINPVLQADSLSRPLAIAGPVKDAAGPDAGLESRTLLWVTGVAAIVLLIACANVANLMLARMLRRRREIAVRLALGVSRARLAAQFITEGVLLAMLGSVAGLFVAQWAGVAIRGLLLPEGSPFDLFRDARTLGVTAGCALAAAALTALAPALLSTRGDLAAALKAGVREGAAHRSATRAALLVVQGALSVVLLVGAGLFVESLSHVRALPLGYDARPVLEVIPDYRGLEMDSLTRVLSRRRLLAAAQALPGVEYAARVNSRLFGTNTTDLRVPGIDSLAPLGRFSFQLSTSDYFKVMGTRILRGRPLTTEDREGTPPVAVVSDAMARVLWPGKDAIGQCLYVGWGAARSAERAPCTTVVGIAEDAAQQAITDTQRFMYYLSVDQLAPDWVSTLLLRMSAADAAAQAERVRRALTREMPGQGFVAVRPLQELVDDQQRSWRLGAATFVGFGVLALVVAAVGLYGVMSYDVAQRMHELGVRVALGAQARDVLRLVVARGLSLAAAGVVIGGALALVAAPWIQPLLFHQPARDPATFAAVGAVVILVALVASAVPAARAARADPNAALRSE